MADATDAVVGVVLAGLLIALLAFGMYMLGGYFTGTSNTITKATTLTAVVKGRTTGTLRWCGWVPCLR